MNRRLLIDCIVNFRDVQHAVSHLKAHKNDGSNGLTRDHNAGDDCLVCKLGSLIKYRLVHSYCMSLYGSELWPLGLYEDWLINLAALVYDNYYSGRVHSHTGSTKT